MAAEPKTTDDGANTGSKAESKKPKHTYMLHEVGTYSCIGKMAGSDYRYAGLKAASRGHKCIWVRRTNTKEMREYQGDIVKLETPKEVKRGDRTITYTQRPTVKFVKKWTFQGPTTQDDSVPITKKLPQKAEGEAPAA